MQNSIDMMLPILTALIDRLDSPAVRETDTITWGCPVPSFGNISTSCVATLGLNPSNREFMDERGSELQGIFRRFHTLQSLGLKSWSEVDARHLRLVIDSYFNYFTRNPYDGWFKKLDQVITGTGTSFYSTSRNACHLDVIPYATTRKWVELNARQKSLLTDVAADSLGLLLRDSPVQLLVLNGQSVVEQFQDISGVSLERRPMSAWSLPRQPKPDVTGVAYIGTADRISGISLSREILVLGYNHNIQSSFGVTNNVVTSIRNWISQIVEQEVI